MNLALVHLREIKEDFYLQILLKRNSLPFGCEAVSNQIT